jgi:Pyruvate/2-oxoacid:ferredoxin oxidoreductase delta subunit
MKKPPHSWSPSSEQMALWPSVSGNTLNGLGEPRHRRPTPIYWHAPDATPHGPLQRWFYGRATAAVQAARAVRQRAVDEPVSPVAPVPTLHSAEEWTQRVKEVARSLCADAVGIAEVRDEWIFTGHEVRQRWVIVVGVLQTWEAIATAPDEAAAVEVITQYARGIRIAKGIASFLQQQGHAASPHGGPMAFPLLLIPAAIAAGLGELGKHGSLIHPTLGSSFRLACVLTDVPLVPDAPIDFGADDFCARCQACTQACPPQAIYADKQQVRGDTRWYVDFDKCLPYFNEHQGCAVCLAACPWNRPGVAANLLHKLAVRRARL